MSIYLKSIHIKKLFHLSGIDINVCEAGKMKHLLITGPNGTGKTLLLGAIVDYLEKIAKDPDLLFLNYEKYLKDNERLLASAKTNEERIKFQKGVEDWTKLIEEL